MNVEIFREIRISSQKIHRRVLCDTGKLVRLYIKCNVMQSKQLHKCRKVYERFNEKAATRVQAEIEI